MDVEIPIKSSETNFAIEVELTDYLGKKSVQRIDLETMKIIALQWNLQFKI